MLPKVIFILLSYFIIIILPFFFCFYLSDPVDSIDSTSFIHGIPTYIYNIWGALHCIRGEAVMAKAHASSFSLHGVYNCINWFCFRGSGYWGAYLVWGYWLVHQYMSDLYMPVESSVHYRLEDIVYISRVCLLILYIKKILRTRLRLKFL